MATCNCSGPAGNCRCMRNNAMTVDFVNSYLNPNLWDKINKPCLNPSHNFPSMLVIPPGESYTHKCPGCGMCQTVRSPILYW